jgi:hypothetical protein
LQVKADLTREQAEMISTAIETVGEPAKAGRKPAMAAAKPMGPEAIQGRRWILSVLPSSSAAAVRRMPSAGSPFSTRCRRARASLLGRTFS